MRRRLIGALAALLATTVGIATHQESEGGTASAIVADYEGIIHPIAAEFFHEIITRADTSDARLVVLVLRTPGGLLESTRTIVSRLIAARTPVVVFVAPSGARAASAGFILTLAADVAAMAPGTHIGAAHPVAAGGERESQSDVLSAKAASDTAAYARALAGARHRNVGLAAEAVLESRAFTDQEAYAATPPLVDVIATDVNDLMRQLDGRSITRFDGRPVTLKTEGLVIERAEMTLRQRLLSAIAHPQIAYLLMSLGMLGLVVELWNPGAILPGVVGGICLLLAFFAFQVLSVNATGIALIVLGLALLVVEVMMPSFGVLGIGGIVALVAGSLMVTSEVPGVHVDARFVVAVASGVGAIAIFLGRLAVKAHHSKPVTGAEALVGLEGHALATIGPDLAGQVRVHGEIWRASSPDTIPAGTKVRVTALEGLTLHVRPIDSPIRGNS
jgi:membrane-bound serine protease (ClpP class)